MPHNKNPESSPTTYAILIKLSFYNSHVYKVLIKCNPNFSMKNTTSAQLHFPQNIYGMLLFYCILSLGFSRFTCLSYTIIVPFNNHFIVNTTTCTSSAIHTFLLISLFAFFRLHSSNKNMKNVHIEVCLHNNLGNKDRVRRALVTVLLTLYILVQHTESKSHICLLDEQERK